MKKIYKLNINYYLNAYDLIYRKIKKLRDYGVYINNYKKMKFTNKVQVLYKYQNITYQDRNKKNS